nr:hypothetical protein [Tanacetum cinerariifolium]
MRLKNARLVELCTPETAVVQKEMLKTRYLFLNFLKIVQDVLGDGEACQRCTCTRCGSGLSKGLCYIFGNNQNSLNDSPSIFENSSQSPPHINHHCCYECGDPLDGIFCKRCTCKSCRKDAHIGYNCPPKVPVISNPEPCKNQTIDELPQTLPSFHPTFHSGDESPFTCDSTPNYFDESPNVFNPPPQPPVYSCEFCENDAHYGHYCTPQAPFIYPESCYNQDFNFPQDFHNFSQQYPCCDNCGVTYEAYQCQPMNEDYYHGQNSCYDSTSIGFDQSQPQQYTKQEEKRIEEEQAAKAQNWKLPVCYDDDDDEERSNSLKDNIISGLPPCAAITPNEPVDSLSMGDEHLNTIPVTESDEFIKSSVENLVPIPSEPEGESECDIDSLLDEFAGELTLLKSIPPGIDETDCSPEEETHFTKRLLYDNSSPRPPKEFVSANSDAEIESFSLSPIPVKDSDSLMEEIDLSFTSDSPMPSGIEDDDYDSERDILILKDLPSIDTPSLLEIESFHFDIPSFPRPPAKPPDGNTGILNIEIMGDISDQKAFMHKLMITLASHQEKSPYLLSHRGLKAFQPSATCPMMIHEKNNPILDVLLFHFYPP